MYCCIESLPLKLVSNIQSIDNRYCSLFIRWLFLFLIIKQMCVFTELFLQWRLSWSFCGMPLYRSLTRNTRERPSTANILWHMNMAAHVLLLGDTWLTCVTQHSSGETDGAGEVDHVSRISVCVPSQKMAQKQFSILQNIQIRLSDKCLKVSHSSRLQG